MSAAVVYAILAVAWAVAFAAFMLTDAVAGHRAADLDPLGVTVRLGSLIGVLGFSAAAVAVVA